MSDLLKKIYNVKTENDTVKKSFLFGVLKTKYFTRKLNYEVRFCGIVIFKTKINKGYEKFYLFGIPIFIQNTRHKLYNSILDKIDENYTDIYINFNCSGETYLFLSYLNPSSKCLFIATKKYHIDLVHMMHPEIECVYIPDILPLRGIDNIYKEKYKGRTFYNILPFKHFIKLENDLRRGINLHYCEEICKTMGVNYSKKAGMPFISEAVKRSAIKKAHIIGLNLSKFIFICPESHSNKKLSAAFWNNITETLYSNNYDVFINALELNAAYGIGKTCFLNFEEAYYLASLSKGIIGLRSGFMEPLTSINNMPVVCLYTDFKDRGLLHSMPSDIIKKGFSLKKLPNAVENNIFEYNMEKPDILPEILNNILSDLKLRG